MKPPVAKTRLAPELRARVLELRRTHSAGEVAKLTGLPVGTIKALVSRAGVTRDNAVARAFFALPALVLVDSAAVAVPVALPERRGITGHADTDAMLWLRQVIETGDEALNAKAIRRPISKAETVWRLVKIWNAEQRGTPIKFFSNTGVRAKEAFPRFI